MLGDSRLVIEKSQSGMDKFRCCLGVEGRFDGVAAALEDVGVDLP